MKFRLLANGIYTANAMRQLTVVAAKKFMTTVSYRFPKEKGHQMDKSTPVMIAIKAKISE